MHMWWNRISAVAAEFPHLYMSAPFLSFLRMWHHSCPALLLIPLPYLIGQQLSTILPSNFSQILTSSAMSTLVCITLSPGQGSSLLSGLPWFYLAPLSHFWRAERQPILITEGTGCVMALHSSESFSDLSTNSRVKAKIPPPLRVLLCLTLCCCCCWVASVVSDPVRPHRRQPTRLLVPGILQARTLEWVAMSFSSAWKWKVKAKSPSRVRLLATPWTTAYQAPPSMGFSRQGYWSGVPLPSPA